MAALCQALPISACLSVACSAAKSLDFPETLRARVRYFSADERVLALTLGSLELPDRATWFRATVGLLGGESVVESVVVRLAVGLAFWLVDGRILKRILDSPA
jgi:hypothetical protein